MEWITSRQNPLSVHIRKLGSDRKYRRSSGCFLCEGTKLTAEAAAWGAALETVVCAQGVEPPEGLRDTVRLVSVPEEVFRSLSTMENPQGMMGVCSTPETSLPEGLPPGGLLVLDGVQDPGNVGTIWRTADAFGAAGLVLLPGCADPFSPKTVRASMGACFRLPVWEAGLDELDVALRRAGVPLYATALREDTEDVRSAALAGAAVIIGSEGRGVSRQALERCQKTLKIPMRERCESLNAAVAAAVVLWEMAR